MAPAISERQRQRFLDLCRAGPNCCIIFTGSYRGNGYGAAYYRQNGKTVACNAHQFAFVLFGGEIEKGRYVCHTCDNKRCVNPRHLYSGTPTDNARDMMQRRRRVCNQRLNSAQVREIQVMLAEGIVQRVIADRFGIVQQRVSQIKSGVGLDQILLHETRKDAVTP